MKCKTLCFALEGKICGWPQNFVMHQVLCFVACTKHKTLPIADRLLSCNVLLLAIGFSPEFRNFLLLQPPEIDAAPVGSV
jgi:hypothetical protein